MADTNLDSQVLSRSAVEFRNVTRVYGTSGTQEVALVHVTVEFPSESWTVVMGPSGWGRSTLLHTAGGLEKVTSGQVLVDGGTLPARPSAS